jgi:hypothetical protein
VPQLTPAERGETALFISVVGYALDDMPQSIMQSAGDSGGGTITFEH